MKNYETDVYNEVDGSKRLSLERTASPETFFYKTGNPFLGFMQFLRRIPVPPKPIDDRRLMADFGVYAKKKRKLQIMGTILGIVCFITIILIKAFNVPALIALPVDVVVIAFFAFIGKKNIDGGYYGVEDYKSYVVSRAVGDKVEGLVYEPRFGLPESVFRDIKLIKTGNRYRTEDLITGKYHGVYFVQSDLRVEHENNDGKSIYFKGRWIVVDYPKKFSGTVIVADKKQPVLCKHKELERIELENPLFNDIFDIKASDMQLAYYLLTPQLMERLIYIKNNTSGKVSLCFKDGYIHIGINNHHNAFEPNIKNINLYNDINRFAYDFSLVIGLIEILGIDNNVYNQAR